MKPVLAAVPYTLASATGTGLCARRSAKIIRFIQQGCTNRPFFHIVVTERMRYHLQPPIEQIGTYDPMPNIHNEKLVSFNFERVNYWMETGALLSKPVAELFGLCGYFPIHPKTYLRGWRNRKVSQPMSQVQEGASSS